MKFLHVLAAILICFDVSASEVTTWSTTSDNNNSTPPNGWPEGMQYSQVNNAAREMMGAIARWRDTMVSGTYTPTLTNGVNTSSLTPYQANYIRIGNIVFVSGGLTAVVTATETFTYIIVSLPIASNFTTDRQGSGTCAVLDSNSLGGIIISDVSADKIRLVFNSHGIGLVNISFSASYQIL